MSVPTNRSEFKEFILRQLGKPVIQVNVTEEQIDDQIDMGLKFFYDYHYDGMNKLYYKHQITNTDKTNRYITLPENIIGAVRIFPISSSLTGTGIWNIRYQMVMSDLFIMNGIQLLPYYMTMQNLQMVEQMLVGHQPIRYNRHSNKLDIDMDWDTVQSGEFLIVEAYEVMDPDDYADVWGDRWLTKYCTALVQKVWGFQLNKMKGMKLPGGIEFNGQFIYDTAVKEIKDLEDTMIKTMAMPPLDEIG